MKDQSCENCKFLLTGDPDKELNRQYFCRRFPPTAMLLPNPRGIGQFSSFPVVQTRQWCGEWSPANTSIQ
jgi:hypothetical protein